MSQRTEDAWIQISDDYVRLKTARLQRPPPRRKANRLAPAEPKSHANSNLSRWPTRELESLAASLGILHATERSREELLEFIEDLDGRRHI